MNITKYLPIFLLLFSFNFYAQGKKMEEKREQIKTLKVAFLTTELNLTTKEAEKFWPIYNTFDDKQFEIRHLKMRTFRRKINDDVLNKMSEKEANNFLAQMESADEELFLLRKKFVANLKEILPAVKIIKLKKAEEDFNRKLLHQYRERGQKK